MYCDRRELPVRRSGAKSVVRFNEEIADICSIMIMVIKWGFIGKQIESVFFKQLIQSTSRTITRERQVSAEIQCLQQFECTIR